MCYSRYGDRDFIPARSGTPGIARKTAEPGPLRPRAHERPMECCSSSSPFGTATRPTTGAQSPENFRVGPQSYIRGEIRQMDVSPADRLSQQCLGVVNDALT